MPEAGVGVGRGRVGVGIEKRVNWFLFWFFSLNKLNHLKKKDMCAKPVW